MSNDKIYQIPDEMFEEEVGSSEEEMRESSPRRNRTGAKKSKGKTIALSLLIIGGLVAGTIFGTKAYYSHQETKRVDNLIANYQVENYVSFPSQIVSDRAYDITYADGAKLADRLQSKEINYISINGQFYTPEGIDVAMITYNVTYTDSIAAIKVTTDGQTVYMAPTGYTLEGNKAVRNTVEVRTVVVPTSDDYSYVRFPSATSWEMVGEPQVLHTLPYEMIENSTLICDVPDGAVLDENNQCYGTLDLAPKKR